MRDTKQEVLNFWFVETDPSLWFQKNAEFDTLITDKYESTYIMAQDGLCDTWAGDADGALALILILDQFPRNMYRNTRKAYATDNKALLIAKQAISKGFDQVLVPEKKRFMYLPYMHSEAMSDQVKSVSLFKAMSDVDPLGYEYALKHYAVIEEFGRYPHRNQALERENTTEEKNYLSKNDSGF